MAPQGSTCPTLLMFKAVKCLTNITTGSCLSRLLSHVYCPQHRFIATPSKHEPSLMCAPVLCITPMLLLRACKSPTLSHMIVTFSQCCCVVNFPFCTGHFPRHMIANTPNTCFGNSLANVGCSQSIPDLQQQQGCMLLCHAFARMLMDP